MSIALTHVLQKGPLLQQLVSLCETFGVDQCQSDWVGSDFLHQLQLLMSVHFEKQIRLKGPTLFYSHPHQQRLGSSDYLPGTSFLHSSGCVIPRYQLGTCRLFVRLHDNSS